MDTIFALATAQGRAGVAVIRLSGPQSFPVARALGAKMAHPRQMERVKLRHDGLVLDDALAVGFVGPGSFTGEDVVELHVHGGRATVASVLRVLTQFPKVRLAEGGEFTRRALENGKLQIEDVEGLIDLIDAETEAQRRQAMRQLDGVLGRAAESWRARLVEALMLMEASIDFSEEELPPALLDKAVDAVANLRNELSIQLSGMTAARGLREGFEVAIVGPPNVGKSTLLNAIARRDVAITSPIPGTTRDVIEVKVDLFGLPVMFLDTAGLRPTDDHVEGLGVARGQARAALADLKIVLLPADGFAMLEEPNTISRMAMADRTGCDPRIGVSGLTGLGVPELLQEVHQRLESALQDVGVLVQERHKIVVERAVSELDLAQSSHASGASIEIVCEHVRSAGRTLGELTGRVDTEEILGAIFSRFCIGK